MNDATTLERVFEDFKDAVERLDDRVAGVEHRVAIISTRVDRTDHDSRIVLVLPAQVVYWVHIILGVIAAIIIFRIVHCIMLRGGV